MPPDRWPARCSCPQVRRGSAFGVSWGSCRTIARPQVFVGDDPELAWPEPAAAGARPSAGSWSACRRAPATAWRAACGSAARSACRGHRRESRDRNWKFSPQVPRLSERCHDGQCLHSRCPARAAACPATDALKNSTAIADARRTRQSDAGTTTASPFARVTGSRSRRFDHSAALDRDQNLHRTLAGSSRGLQVPADPFARTSPPRNTAPQQRCPPILAAICSGRRAKHFSRRHFLLHRRQPSFKMQLARTAVVIQDDKSCPTAAAFPR